MTPEERYLFDLMGFVVAPGALTAAEVADLNACLDALDIWAMVARREQTEHNNALKTHTGPVLEWGEPFRKLVEHPVLLAYLTELLGEKLRLDHEYAIFMKPGAPGLGLHGGGAPYDPAQYYHYRNERFYNGLTVAAFALCEVGLEDGGFCCIPGSHKSNVPRPPAFPAPERGQPWLLQPTLRAGDLLIFTEALTHGTLAWTAPHERRSLLFKFSPGHLAWGKPSRLPKEGDDETLRRLLEPPYVAQRKPVQDP